MAAFGLGEITALKCIEAQFLTRVEGVFFGNVHRNHLFGTQGAQAAHGAFQVNRVVAADIDANLAGQCQQWPHGVVVSDLVQHDAIATRDQLGDSWQQGCDIVYACLHGIHHILLRQVFDFG